MDQQASVTTWIGKLKSGDEEAAEVLWQRYFSKLVHLARYRLTGVAKQVNDEEDVALSAFNSFCLAVTQQRYPRLEGRDDLWQLLVMHTARKAIDQRRYLSRQKRGGASKASAGSPSIEVEELVGSEPDPQFVALMLEQFERLMSGLNTELHSIALLKLEGYTNQEISEKLNYGVRTVQRKITLIRTSWKEALEELT